MVGSLSAATLHTFLDLESIIWLSEIGEGTFQKNKNSSNDTWMR